MEIVFYCPSGSPIGITPQSYWGEDGRAGLGGAEAALVWITWYLSQRGHNVTVYNNPDKPDNYNGVEYKRHGDFDITKPVEAFVLYRNPWMGVMRVKAKTRVFWSCDQQTTGDFATQIFPWVDQTIAISPYHKQYLVDRYGANPDTIRPTDLGVNGFEYYNESVQKIPNRLIYCSQPERGLLLLLAAYPQIKRKVPDASLVITADRRLWGVDYTGDEQYRAAQRGLQSEDVHYLGAIPRSELTKHQMQADIQAYPCTYPELFCISAAECQIAGAVPVTTTIGALETTVGIGVKMDDDPNSPEFVDKFAATIVDMLQDRACLKKAQDKAKKYGATRFLWGDIAGQWESMLDELLA